MLKVVVLDTTPLGLATQKAGKSPVVDRILTWVEDLTKAGVRIAVPEIADYEVRRELLRAGNIPAVTRMDDFNTARPDRYLPLTTAHMRRAAQLWADARNSGFATAERFALDGDVILCAQALALGVAPEEIVVATSNTKHIGRFIAAQEWEKITL